MRTQLQIHGAVATVAAPFSVGHVPGAVEVFPKATGCRAIERIEELNIPNWKYRLWRRGDSGCQCHLFTRHGGFASFALTATEAVPEAVFVSRMATLGAKVESPAILHQDWTSVRHHGLKNLPSHQSKVLACLVEEGGLSNPEELTRRRRPWTAWKLTVTCRLTG